MAKRKSANWDAPIWFDGTNINEALFCDEFLSSRKIIFATEPALNHDIVRPARLPVHALLDVQIAQKLLVFVACELYALI